MRNLLLSFAVAGTLGATALPASALPGVQPLPLAGDAPAVTLVRNGCGLYRHRAINGLCYPNRGFYRRPFFPGRPFHRFYRHHRFYRY